MKWSLACAGVGAVVWFSSALGLGFGSLEHVFLVAPLIATPLALAVLGSTLERYQPLAAVLLVASFLDANRPRSAGLATAWLVFAVALLVSALRRRVRNPSVMAAHVFLVMGAAWLVLWRLGVAPRNLSPLRVFLAATHFHFSGFLLQTLIAATGHTAPKCLPLQRNVAVGAIVGILLLLVGNVLAIPGVKFAGVACMVVVSLVLALTAWRVALAATSTRRWLLLVSATSIVAGMLVALVYGIGELTGGDFIPLPRMVQVHGLVNAFGFTVCGLLGHLVSPYTPGRVVA